MIDITTVNPNSIPPEIEILQKENSLLIKENYKLSQYSKIAIVAVIICIIIGSAIAANFKDKKYEK